MTNPYAQTGETATRFAERMLAELETDMGVHHDEPFVRMSRLRLHELRNAIQGLLARPEAAGMTESRARELLSGAVDKDGGLYNLGWYLGWTPGESDATLDGQFTADDLEAVAWWMRNKGPQ